MKLGRNLLAGLANSVWSALIVLAMVPIYIKYLGVEAFGLIGFLSSLQAILTLLDLGITPTISREVARCSANGCVRAVAGAMHTFGVVTWGMAILIVVSIALVAPRIATYWFHSELLSKETLTNAIIMMGVVIASRWPAGLYHGALIGAQRLVLPSIVNMASVTVGAVGAVVILDRISPTIEAFFMWQAFVGLAYTMAMRKAAWQTIGIQTKQRFQVEVLKDVWKFTAGMSGVAITGLIFTQLDKLILSRILTLEQFGLYMLAVVLVSGFYIIVKPIFSIAYPLMTELVTKEKNAELVELYLVGSRMLASILFPLVMIFSLLAVELISVWTGDRDVALVAAPVASVMAFGTAFHGVMHFPYALQLGFGKTALPLYINLVLLILMVPMLMAFSVNYGALGASYSWMLIEFIYLCAGPWVTHKYLLKEIPTILFYKNIGIPLGLTLGAWMLQAGLITLFEPLVVTKVIVGIGSMLFVVAISCFITQPIRVFCIRFIRGGSA